MLGFKTLSGIDAVCYLTLDSPKTPKIIIADAELSVETTVIAAKMKSSLEEQLHAYSVNKQAVLGLLVGSNMMLHAIRIEDGVISKFHEIVEKDLTLTGDLLTI